MKIKLILIFVLIALFANQTYALGIAPSHYDVVFEPSLEKNFQLKIMNNAKKDMDVIIYAEGDLAQYITINNPRISISKEEESKIISYNVNLPANLDKQGVHEAKVVAREIPKGSKGETSVSANLAVASKLKINVPYKGKYAEIKLFATNFKQNEQSNFAVEVRNLGTEDIIESYAIINIYDPLNNKVATVTSNRAEIASKGKEILIANWKPDVGPGNYRAVATLMYDSLNTQDEKSFTVGKLSLDIVSITVNNFKLGGIAQFDIIVENNWNEDIPNVFAETSVKDSSGKTYTQFKTASVDIPLFSSQELNAYWDTAKVTTGPYKLDIVLNYLGQKNEKVFDIMVDYNEIKTSLVGQAIGARESETPAIMKAIYILIFLVIALIAFNIIVYFKKMRK
jgi:methionine-rich copper-binding protein CopC